MTLQFDFERLRLARKAVCAELMTERTATGQWVGGVSSSPLATATAVSALVLAHDSDAGVALIDDAQVDRPTKSDEGVLDQIVQSDLSELIVQSLHWLAQQQNEDGGWSDSTRGKSSIAATLLVQAAFRLTGVPARYADLMDLADEYVEAQGGIANLRGDSDRDKTLATPILANCALAGMVPWRQVPALPFELACLPQPWIERLRLPLDRLEIPSLVAIGQSKLHHDRPRNPINRMLRNAMRASSLTIIEQMQAADGSFLGGVPNTAVVVMGLASVGQQRHPIVERGVEYLLATMRPDASWPAVANLAVTNTTLVINELSSDFRDDGQSGGALSQGDPSWQSMSRLDDTMIDTAVHSDTVVDFPMPGDFARPVSSKSPNRHEPIVDCAELFDRSSLLWLLDSQKTNADPATGAAPGGWGWNDSPGAVPNVSDSASAVRALAAWFGRASSADRDRISKSAHAGLTWLLAAQNEDGGWPMWQEERSVSNPSAPDSTSGVLRALVAWQPVLRLPSHSQATASGAGSLPNQVVAAIERGFGYLAGAQRKDGSFAAIGVANVHQADSENPVMGTACVLQGCADLDRLETEMATRAAQWLLSAQHSGGGWGPPRAPLDYSGAYKNGAYAWRENDILAKHCSVEETSVAISALLPLAENNPAAAQAVATGLNWLTNALEQDQHHHPAVIGFSFAKLWYHERLYPLAFAAGALARAVRQLAPQRPVTTSVG